MTKLKITLYNISVWILQAGEKYLTDNKMLPILTAEMHGNGMLRIG